MTLINRPRALDTHIANQFRRINMISKVKFNSWDLRGCIACFCHDSIPMRGEGQDRRHLIISQNKRLSLHNPRRIYEILQGNGRINCNIIYIFEVQKSVLFSDAILRRLENIVRPQIVSCPLADICKYLLFSRYFSNVCLPQWGARCRASRGPPCARRSRRGRSRRCSAPPPRPAPCPRVRAA